MDNIGIAYNADKSWPVANVTSSECYGGLPNHITLFDLAVDPPALWDEQRERVGL